MEVHIHLLIRFASKTTIKSGIDGKYSSELSYVFKWDDKLNVLTFFMKNE